MAISVQHPLQDEFGREKKDNPKEIGEAWESIKRKIRAEKVPIATMYGGMHRLDLTTFEFKCLCKELGISL